VRQTWRRKNHTRLRLLFFGEEGRRTSSLSNSCFVFRKEESWDVERKKEDSAYLYAGGGAMPTSVDLDLDCRWAVQETRKNFDSCSSSKGSFFTKIKPRQREAGPYSSSDRRFGLAMAFPDGVVGGKRKAETQTFHSLFYVLYFGLGE
jgi:hypothetical protein